MALGETTKEAQRIAQLQAILAQKGMPAALILNPENRHYLAGFKGSNGWLLITPDRAALITDGRYWTNVEQDCPAVELVKFVQEEHGWLGQTALRWLRDHDLHKLGFESALLNVGDYHKLQSEASEMKLTLELVEFDGHGEQLRQVKEDVELEALRASARCADRAFRKALEIFQEGISEREFCIELEYQMCRHGARKPSFDSIVASGPNGAYPHASVTDRKIQAGELVTVDFGALVGSYCSDTTRTIWLGQLDEESARVYSTVREAQKRAVDAIRSGRIGRDIDKVARDIIAAAGYGSYFNHGLGHGVGLAVHELPSLRTVSEHVLRPKMVVTVEPGIYIPGKTGCRVEDSVVVLEDGVEYLTRSTYQELHQRHPLEGETR